jgi:hypothetical protein
MKDSKMQSLPCLIGTGEHQPGILYRSRQPLKTNEWILFETGHNRFSSFQIHCSHKPSYQLTLYNTDSWKMIVKVSN